MGAATLRSANEKVSVDDINDEMLDIQDILEDQRARLDALALAPSSADDESELEKELEELEQTMADENTATQIKQLQVESTEPTSEKSKTSAPTIKQKKALLV